MRWSRKLPPRYEGAIRFPTRVNIHSRRNYPLPDWYYYYYYYYYYCYGWREYRWQVALIASESSDLNPWSCELSVRLRLRAIEDFSIPWFGWRRHPRSRQPSSRIWWSTGRSWSRSARCPGTFLTGIGISPSASAATAGPLSLPNAKLFSLLGATGNTTTDAANARQKHSLSFFLKKSNSNFTIFLFFLLCSNSKKDCRNRGSLSSFRLPEFLNAEALDYRGSCSVIYASAGRT